MLEDFHNQENQMLTYKAIVNDRPRPLIAAYKLIISGVLLESRTKISM